MKFSEKLLTKLFGNNKSDSELSKVSIVEPEKPVRTAYQANFNIPTSTQTGTAFGQTSYQALSFSIHTKDAEAFIKMAEKALENGSFQEMLGHSKEALKLDPNHFMAHKYHSIACYETGQWEKAEESFRQVIALKPDYPEGHYNLGKALQQMSRIGEALDNYKRAIELRPEYVAAYNNLGVILDERGQFDEAESNYRQALSFDPTFAETYNNLGNTLQKQGRRAEAIASYRKAIEFDPENNVARLSLLFQSLHLCEWDDLESDIREIRRVVRDRQVSSNNNFPPFMFLALPGTTAEEQMICAENFSRPLFQLLQPLRNKLGFEFKHPPKSKIHIGYLSGDFHDHPVAKLMAEIFELHDHNRFKVTAYSYGPDDGSSVRHRVMQAFDHFVEIGNLSIEDAARKIYADRVDILIDLKGYTADTRSAILALRPAPIQVNFLGYPGTMGNDFVDYIIADSFLMPVTNRENNYAEKVVRMPDCFLPSDSMRPRTLAAPERKDLGLNEDGFVFCCFNQTFKITPQLFSVWCQLLNEIPNSQLWLFATNSVTEVNLRKEAEKQGIAQNRLVMAPRVDLYEDHLARLQCADVFLDTLPYNAHTTCSEALWMGLPVVTCAGDTFASRVAGSLLTALDVPELITYSLEDYYNLALQLATDVEKMAKVRKRILDNRDTMPLFDTKRFTRNLEEAFDGMIFSFKNPNNDAGIN
jgi:predicted O-linked N-acetylglucosamine transferase (SPINDLY family)